jgi:hypothetical protein
MADRFSTPSVDPANSYRDNVDETRKHLNTLDSDRETHETDPEAHGVDQIQSDLTAVESEVQTARGSQSALDGRLDLIEGDVGSVETEVTNARGSQSALDTRLAEALNPDGSIRLGTLVDEYLDPKWSVAYVDATTFKVQGEDVTDMAKADVVLRLTVDGSYKYGIITSSSYGGSDTTVNLRSQDSVLTSNLTKAEIALVAFRDFASSGSSPHPRGTRRW